MSNLEHYFENLLHYGVDNIHEDVLSEEQKETVKVCVNYVLYNIFYGKKDFLDYIQKK